MPDKPKIVVLCGSSRFADVMGVCAWFIERDEHAITMGIHLLPWWYRPPGLEAGAQWDHAAELEGCAAAMDELHLRKIDLADQVFVVDVNGYVGESTAREVAYAESKGIPVRRFTLEPLGGIVTELHDSEVGRVVALGHRLRTGAK
jgi:hypothetical protein